MPRRRRWLGVTLGGLVLLASAALGTTVLRLFEEDMIEQASLIVVGTCNATQSNWQDGDLLTEVEINVEDSIKGDAGDTVTVTVPGGVDANRRFPIAVTYPGAPTLLPGQRLLLFLETDETGRNSIVGFFQGCLTVTEDANGNAVVASLAPRNVNVVDADGALVTMPSPRSEPLTTVLARLRTHVATAAAGR